MKVSSSSIRLAHPSSVFGSSAQKLRVVFAPTTLVNVASIATFVCVWQIASYFAPSYAVPGWGKIIAAMVHVSFADVFITTIRLVGSMVASFILGLGISILIFDRPFLEAFVMPFIRLLMAVPAVCWVVFAILWFSGVEFRIFFVMCIVCAPVFTMDSLDAMKSVPRDLRSMVGSFRPTAVQALTKVILPGIVPNLVTSWKINLTLAIRIVTIAELVGAVSGMGHGLVLAQEVFSVPEVFAWTLVLVAMLLVLQGLISLVEKRALAWRNA
jgi:NitT/TauT family transport system permease protein